MQIGEISSEYKKMLDIFFQDEDVKENMLKAYFGEERYLNNKQVYDELYHEKMSKIIFIPYVTLDDLNHFINIKNNQNTEKNKYNEELKLLNTLKQVRNTVVKEYSSILYDEVKRIYKDIPKQILDENNKKVEQAISEYKDGKRSRSNITNEFESIQNYLNKQLEIKDKNPIANQIKVKKIKKALLTIDKMKNVINEKILMETSSFYENRQHTSNGNSKKSIDISKMGKPPYTDTCLYKRNGKSEDEYYIYLPIGTANSKQEFLEDVVHEVGHVIKLKINNKKFTTGFLEGRIKRDGNIKPTVHGNMRNIWEKMNKHLGQNEIYDKNSYQVYEELMHEFFTEVAINNMKQETKQKLKHPYAINKRGSISLYKDRTDESITGFINNFKELIQEVNATSNVKKFRKLVGKDSFDNLVILMKKDLSNRQKQNYLYPLIKMMGREKIEQNPQMQALIQEEESKLQIEEKIKEEIRAVCQNILTRQQVIEGTKNIPMSLILKMGEMIKTKSREKKCEYSMVSDNEIKR